jgi:hypothetical protein
LTENHYLRLGFRQIPHEGVVGVMAKAERGVPGEHRGIADHA